MSRLPPIPHSSPLMVGRTPRSARVPPDPLLPSQIRFIHHPETSPAGVRFSLPIRAKLGRLFFLRASAHPGAIP